VVRVFIIIYIYIYRYINNKMIFNCIGRLVLMSNDAGFGGGGGGAPNHQSSTTELKCCSPSCVMPGQPVELNPHDSTKPRFSCAISSCNGPLHGGACASEVEDGVFVCHGCINKMVAAGKESNGNDENKKQAAEPTNVDKNRLPTLFFHRGMRVDGRPSETCKSIVTLNPDTDSNDNDIIDGSNVSNTEPEPISEVDEAELGAVVNFCFGGKKSEVVEQLMEKRMCINLQAGPLYNQIRNIIKESEEYLDSAGKLSYSYPTETIEGRKKWLPTSYTNNDSNICGSADRYTVADIEQCVWFEAIFAEIEKMLTGSYCRFQRGFWYFLLSQLPEDNQITKVRFDEIITEVCNIIGASRIKLNIIVVSEGSFVAPLIFHREEEELTITIDGQPRKVVRLAEEYDFTTPSQIPLSLLADFEKVDSMDVHFEIKAERKYVPKYFMAIEAAEVANNMFDQNSMWKAKNKSGMVLHYKGTPKSYHRFLLWILQKHLDTKILVSCECLLYFILLFVYEYYMSNIDSQLM